MTSIAEIAELSLELAGITQEIQDTRRKLEELGKRKPSGGIRQKHREVKWRKKVHSLLERLNILQQRGLQIHKCLADFLAGGDAAIPSDVIEDTERSVQALASYLGGGA